jgi:hypothetical protein
MDETTIPATIAAWSVRPGFSSGHEPQIDLCVANQQPQRFLRVRNRSMSSYSIRLQPRWTYARSAARPNASFHAQGWKARIYFPPSSRGRTMSLTSPPIDLIDQALTLKFRLLSIHLTSGAFCRNRKNECNRGIHQQILFRVKIDLNAD